MSEAIKYMGDKLSIVCIGLSKDDLRVARFYDKLANLDTKFSAEMVDYYQRKLEEKLKRNFTPPNN